MDTQAKLKIGIGTQDPERLEAKPVKVVKVEVVSIEKASSEKLVCTVKHPDKEELIEISSAKYERDSKIVVGGLWFKLDKEQKIQKGSALAIFMRLIGVETIESLIGKEIMTAKKDEKGYLCFKAY